MKTKEAMANPEVRVRYLEGIKKRAPLTQEQLAKRSAKVTEANKRTDVRKKNSEALKATWKRWKAEGKTIKRVITDEYREKLRISSTGRRLSDEAKRKISEAHKGRKHTAEARANMGRPKRTDPK